MIFNCNECAQLAGAIAKQCWEEHTNLSIANGSTYWPMCQHWLTKTMTTCSLENLCCPTIAKCRFVGESQIIPIINLSTAQQVYCHAVGRCTPECCETGDAQGCKPSMLCKDKPTPNKLRGWGERKEHQCSELQLQWMQSLLEPEQCKVEMIMQYQSIATWLTCISQCASTGWQHTM